MDHFDTPRTMAMLTVGGMLGLTAAAAVRWLNGGDFALFPPPTTIVQGGGGEGQYFHSRGAQEDNVDDDDDDSRISRNCDEDDPHEPEPTLASMNDNIRALSQQVQELAALVKAQAESQQRLLKTRNMQHATTATTQFTDQSMALLRRSQKPLAEVKALLEQLTTTTTSSSENEDIQKALNLLNKHLQGESDQHQQQQQQAQHHQAQYQPTSILPNANIVNDVNITATSTTQSISLLRNAIQRLALDTNNIADLQCACQVLHLYVLHLSSNPHVPRYRKIFTTNDTFQKVEKLLPGGAGIDLLHAVGFVQKQEQQQNGGGNCLEWKPENEQDALRTLQYASTALAILKSSSSTTATTTNTVQSLCDAALATLPPAAIATTTMIDSTDE